MAECAIVIIGFRCAEDIATCLSAVEKLDKAQYAVHICENGGGESFEELRLTLAPLMEETPGASVGSSPSVTETVSGRFRQGGSMVHLHKASGNLGYAGGINAVLDVLSSDPAWDAIWILNPDTEPMPDALDALRKRADENNYGIVGSRIVLKHSGKIQMYGGRWRRWMARGFNLGLGEPATAVPDVARVEAEMQYVCGASMYVVRPFIETVGKMDEGYFLYAEEVDWCFRRGDYKLGYAHDSVVVHSHGATIGSNHNRKLRSSFSVYLDERSKMLFTRRFYPALFPLVACSTFLLATQYLTAGAYRNYLTALSGWFAGLRGEKGFPPAFQAKR